MLYKQTLNKIENQLTSLNWNIFTTTRKLNIYV
jgi:hypothetical protein